MRRAAIIVRRAGQWNAGKRTRPGVCVENIVSRDLCSGIKPVSRLARQAAQKAKADSNVGAFVDRNGIMSETVGTDEDARDFFLREAEDM